MSVYRTSPERSITAVRAATGAVVAPAVTRTPYSDRLGRGRALPQPYRVTRARPG